MTPFLQAPLQISVAFWRLETFMAISIGHGSTKYLIGLTASRDENKTNENTKVVICINRNYQYMYICIIMNSYSSLYGEYKKQDNSVQTQQLCTILFPDTAN